MWTKIAVCDLLFSFSPSFGFFEFIVFSFIHSFILSLSPSHSIFRAKHSFGCAKGKSNTLNSIERWYFKYEDSNYRDEFRWVYRFWVAVIIQITWKQSESINLSDMHDKREEEEKIPANTNHIISIICYFSARSLSLCVPFSCRGCCCRYRLFRRSSCALKRTDFSLDANVYE